jgi:hypothetical protein
MPSVQSLRVFVRIPHEHRRGAGSTVPNHPPWRRPSSVSPRSLLSRDVTRSVVSPDAKARQDDTTTSETDA